MAKVLVIDDEKDVGMIFSKVLGEEGFKVMSSSSGEAGIEEINKNKPDLVFLDLRMPGIDGIETLRRIRKVNLELPVIIMTAYQTVNSAVESMKLGAHDYLIKPLEADRVKSVAKQALEVTGLAQKVRSKKKEEPHQTRPHEKIVAEDTEMQNVIQLIDKVSATNLTVLILGESGTGKEIVARTVHEKSDRKASPFIVVDCAALPESLIESELFGYEKGAFTGADTSKPGKFESANKGTLFLDEIGNLPMTVQSKLLRFLQEPVIEHLGGKTLPIPLDVRIIAATNADLEKAISEGRFREDLYHRLNVFPIILPPLRQRGKDIEELIEYFVDKFSVEFQKPDMKISKETVKVLNNYAWPGNIRELQNALQSASLLADNVILPNHLPISIQTSNKPDTHAKREPHVLKDVVKSVEKEHILNTLKKNNWNKKRTSEILGIDYKTLYNKIKEYDIAREEEKDNE